MNTTARTVIGIIVVVLIAAAAYYFYTRVAIEAPSQTAPVTTGETGPAVTEPTDEPLEEPIVEGEAFARWGNIVNIEDTTARLVYEEPGSPGLTVDLVFTMATICVVDEQELTCPLFLDGPMYEQGARVYVEGTQEGDIVTVERIREEASE